MKEQTLLCHSLYGCGIRASCEGLSLVSIASRSDPLALCHFLLQSDEPRTVAFQEDFSLTHNAKKAAFSKRLFSDYAQMLADCSIEDCVHPTRPILRRSYHTARPLTFSLCVPARTKVLPLPPCNGYAGVLQLQFEHSTDCILFAWNGDGRWEDGCFSIGPGSGELLFFALTESSIAKALRPSFAVFPDETPSTQVSAPHERVLSLLSKRIQDGIAFPHALDARYDSDTQSRVLLSLCRLGSPLAHDVASALYHRLQKELEGKRDPDLPSISLAILAWQSYCTHFHKDIPTPLWQFEALLQAARQIKSGMMPFARCDARPYPFCEHGSLLRTVQWLAAANSLLSKEESLDITKQQALRQKAQVVEVQLPIHFFKDGQWIADCALRAIGIRKSQFRFGICPSCYDRAKDAIEKPLQYHGIAKTYLCANCAKGKDFSFSEVPMVDAFDTFGYCAMPHSDFSFCQSALWRAVERAYHYCKTDDLTVLFDLLRHELIDALPCDALAHLAEVLWKAEA